MSSQLLLCAFDTLAVKESGCRVFSARLALVPISYPMSNPAVEAFMYSSDDL